MSPVTFCPHDRLRRRDTNPKNYIFGLIAVQSIRYDDLVVSAPLDRQCVSLGTWYGLVSRNFRPDGAWKGPSGFIRIKSWPDVVLKNVSSGFEETFFEETFDTRQQSVGSSIVRMQRISVRVTDNRRIHEHAVSSGVSVAQKFQTKR